LGSGKFKKNFLKKFAWLEPQITSSVTGEENLRNDPPQHGECLTDETLTDYLGLALDPAMKAASEVHLIACDKCRVRLAFFMRVLRDGFTPDEKQAIDAVAEAWNRRKGGGAPMRRSSVYRRALLWLMAGVLGVAVVWVSMRVVDARRMAARSAEQVVLVLLAQNRPFESQLARQPYRSFAQTRSGNDAGIEYDALASTIVRKSGDSYEMGRFYLLQQQFDTAKPFLESAAHDSKSPEVFNDLGIAYMEMGGEQNLQKAMEAFRRALELDRDFIPAIFNLSIAYERIGALPDAERQWRRYLQLDGTSGWALEVRSKLQSMSR
jgi:tetratricopeptide (TPR) repeat protein